MPEAGSTALLALWNDVDPALDAAYNDWHAREHVPERLTVPGIVWALRYACDGGAPMPRYLTLYGLRDPQVLDSPAYRRLLEHPTPASRAMRPALRNLSRWVCTLDVQEGIERCRHLAVRTVEHAAPVPALTEGCARLVATRIPEAAALPWLAGGQSRPIEGDRLEGLAHDGRQAAWPTATVYTLRDGFNTKS